MGHTHQEEQQETDTNCSFSANNVFFFWYIHVLNFLTHWCYIKISPEADNHQTCWLDACATIVHLISDVLPKALHSSKILELSKQPGLGCYLSLLQGRHLLSLSKAPPPRPEAGGVKNQHGYEGCAAGLSPVPILQPAAAPSFRTLGVEMKAHVTAAAGLPKVLLKALLQFFSIACA